MKIMYSNTKPINMSASFIFLLILVTITQRTLSIEIRRGLKDSIKVSDLKGPSWKFGCGPIWNDKDWCQCDRANINTIQSNSNGKGSCKNICKQYFGIRLETEGLIMCLLSLSHLIQIFIRAQLCIELSRGSIVSFLVKKNSIE